MVDELKKEEGSVKIRKVDITVSPKNCLWFAWAPNPIAGPEGEDETSRPEWDAVLEDASEVKIELKSTSAAKKWRHHPSAARESGPEGLDGTDGKPNDQRGLENPAYRSSTYNSEGILPVTTHLNKLVVMFEIDGEPSTTEFPAEQIPIGRGPKTLSIPAAATKLFLGFHDGHEWKNNDGDNMVIEVTWII